MRDEPRDRDWLSDRLADRADWDPSMPDGDGWQQRAFADLAGLDTAGIERALASFELDTTGATPIEATPSAAASSIAAVLDHQFEVLEASGRFEPAADEFDVLSDLSTGAFTGADDDPLSALVAATSPAAAGEPVAVIDPFDTDPHPDRSASAASDGAVQSDDRPDELLDDITALASDADDVTPAHVTQALPERVTDAEPADSDTTPTSDDQTADTDAFDTPDPDAGTGLIGDGFDGTDAFDRHEPSLDEPDHDRDSDHTDDPFDLGGDE